MEKYSLEKHRKLIEKIRLICFIILGFGVSFQLINIIVGLSTVLVFGLIDQFFIKPKLKPRGKTNV